MLFAKIEDHLDDILKNFWDLEAIGIKDEEKETDSKASQLFEKTVYFDGERYEVQLPWSNEESKLPNNYKQALDRLIQTERSLRRNLTKTQLYENGMKEYLENGFVEEVNDLKGRPGITWYLPHHTVLREDKSSTKCRIVFDGSAQFHNDSLNRQLDPGPPLQNDLVKILLRFRRFRVGLQADISKMFLQIELHEKDRDVTRFLWRELGSQKAPRIFRFRRVCFGLTCSPFLAMSVTRHHALKHLQGFPVGVNQVLENIERGQRNCGQLVALMNKGGFHLTKWVSNLGAVLADVPSEDIMGKNTMTSKTLGIVWDSVNDELAYSVLSEVDPWSRDTKQVVEKGLNWDDELPSDLQKEWQTWKMELSDISDIRIPRCLIPFHGPTINKVELHAFGDASETAYGAVIDLVVTKEDHSTISNLQLVEPSQWRHCPANSNPVNILSRGSTINQLRSNPLWWSGPTWLTDEDSWPKDLESAKPEEYDAEYCVTEERRSVKVLAELVENINLNPDRYEHLDRLLRITAYCIRFGKNCRLPKPDRLVEYVTPLEMQNAENYWIRKAQHERFSTEIYQLSNGRQIAANSRLQQFDPFLDEYGLLRIGGRLQNSDLPEHTKHPILLPESKPFVAKMAPLPSDRIGVIRPFENTGLDIAGPFLRDKGKKRFIARRGKPHALQSDSFKSFKQLDKDLRQLVSTEMIDNIVRELTSHHIQWNFITERAPWMGGYWERLIRSMKTSLKKVLQNSMLDDEEFRTIISEVEARINSRPLTYNPVNPNNPEVLTPYNFLTGTHYVDIPEITKDEDEWVPKTQSTSQLMKSWNLRQRLIAQWWKRWKAEYVTNLNIRKKWYNSGNAPNIGDIVLTRWDSSDCESAASW
ncbi:hypothetical protein T08_3806 [Trichinella sp. T8]|nr:hypothetical protein T08_3806 [Trichinella sp. T8]